jgi:vacuolar-type H+-ATPase subunit E/Vma4
MTGLESVREHHLAAAREQAESIVRGARAQAQEITASGAAAVAALVEHARREGEAAADLDTNREWITARRRARGLVLSAQREMYEELRGAVASAARADPRYPALLERLARAGQRQLGPGAEVGLDRDGEGGVRVSRKGRRIEWSLAAIVGGGLDRLGPRVTELWR